MCLVRPQNFEISQRRNNRLQIPLLPVEFRDYALDGHTRREFYHAPGDFPIPLPKIRRHNGEQACYRRGREDPASARSTQGQAMSLPESPHGVPTGDQLSELERLTDVVKTNCAQLCSLVFRIYGDKNNRTLRAEEIAASIKRFEWAVERGNDGDQAANASV
jgi:hypothetical protein